MEGSCGKEKTAKGSKTNSNKERDMAVTVRKAVTVSTPNKMEKATELDSLFLSRHFRRAIF